eukprot:TRINITY_DN3598_c0_g1_i1.p1 TRINITY_DN3598_c0_g1~~TRINITY_DN3598_c0_g1_i1.p1  ORF type:complete len:402 (-),score=54.07 TRINITY_DN3598_c0_g1_i1:22-1227(-)
MKRVFDKLSAVEKIRQQTDMNWTLICDNIESSSYNYMEVMHLELQPVPWDPFIQFRIRGGFKGGVLELLLLKEKKKLSSPEDMKITSVSFHRERREIAVLVGSNKSSVRTFKLEEDGLQLSSFELPLKYCWQPKMLHRYTDNHFFIRSAHELKIVSSQTGDIETVKFAPEHQWSAKKDTSSTLTGVDEEDLNVFRMEISPDCSYIAAAWSKREDDHIAYLARYNLASKEFKKLLKWDQAIEINDPEMGPNYLEFITNETLQITSNGDTTGIILVNMQTRQYTQSAKSVFLPQSVKRTWEKEEKMADVDNKWLDYDFKRITEDIFTVCKLSFSRGESGKPPLDPISVYSLTKGKLYTFEGMRLLHGYESEKFSYFHLHSRDLSIEQRHPDYFFILTSLFDPK